MKRFRNWWNSNSFRRAVAKKRAQRRAAAGLSSPSPSRASRADDIYPPWLYGEGAEPVNMPPQTGAAIAAALSLNHFEGMGGSAGGAGASASYGASECQPTDERAPNGFAEAESSHSSNDSGGYSDSGSSCSSDSGSSGGGDSGGGGGGGD